MDNKRLKLASFFLGVASEELGRHGCNDFNLAEHLPDVKDRRALLKAMEEENGTPEQFDPAGDYSIVMDWWIAGFLGKELEKMASEQDVKESTAAEIVNVVNGAHVFVPGTVLIKMSKERAEFQTTKCKEAEDKLKEFIKLGELAKEKEELESSSFKGVSYTTNYKDPIQDLKFTVGEYSRKARFYEFLATYLKEDCIYKLSMDDLRHWGIKYQ